MGFKKLIFLLFCPLLMQGQNLIPNFSFEDTAKLAGSLYLPSKWNVSTSESFDYFTPEHNFSQQHLMFSAPSNTIGFQEANTGKAYLGFLINHLYTSRRNPRREYAQTMLERTLVQDSTYCLQLFVSMADSSRFASRGQLAVYFSDTGFVINTYGHLPFIPQIIVSPNQYITDKIEWTEFNFEYKAAGGERYLTIGNFNDTTLLDTLGVGGGDPNNINFNNTYYYVDDIWLSHCDSIRDSIIGINENDLANSISVYPNPFKGFFTIKTSQPNNLTFRCFNLLGEEITYQLSITKTFNEYHVLLNDIPKGIYLLNISDGKETESIKLISK